MKQRLSFDDAEFVLKMRLFLSFVLELLERHTAARIELSFAVLGQKNKINKYIKQQVGVVE